jgi:hypothetical protein
MSSNFFDFFDLLKEDDTKILSILLASDIKFSQKASVAKVAPVHLIFSRYSG